MDLEHAAIVIQRADGTEERYPVEVTQRVPNCTTFKVPPEAGISNGDTFHLEGVSLILGDTEIEWR